MKKIIKVVQIGIAIVIISFIILLVFDCFRLKELSQRVIKPDTKPIITIKKEKIKNGTVYYGLGYSIKYYHIPNTMGYGATFKLFNIIVIWNWEAL